MELDKIIVGDSAIVLKTLSDESVDLTVTSPPYDNLRAYKGFVFDFETIARELYRVTKQGGVVVWVVGDATVNGSETGTSFKQALFFKECGFNLHDTMIWNKNGFSAVGALKTRYAQVFEYMFVFTKGKISKFNAIKDKINRNAGKTVGGTIRQIDGKTKPMSKIMVINDFGQRYNIWDIFPQRQSGESHPAPFPEALAQDHIISWSNENDTVLDCFAGSGTTLKMAKLLNRHYIGIEISPEYAELAQKRVDGLHEQTELK